MSGLSYLQVMEIVKMFHGASGASPQDIAEALDERFDEDDIEALMRALRSIRASKDDRVRLASSTGRVGVDCL